MNATEAGEVSRLCPECGAEIRHDRRFTPWCPHCEWNVDPLRAAEEQSRLLERRRRVLARRHGEGLLREIGDGAPLRPHRDASSVLAQVLAVLVHGITVVLIGLGIWFIVAGLGVTLFVVGLFLLAIAIVLRPHVVRLPDDVPLLDRSSAPELFAMVDDVASVVGTRGIDRIAIDGHLNASVSFYGLRGRRLLTIGLPLWEILSSQERIALLGHELGHLANGDLRHGTLVWSAASSLRAWSYLFAPRAYSGSWGLVVVNVITYLPWLAIEGVRMLLDALTLRATQRGEYLADRFAAMAGGADAAICLMDRFLLESLVATALGRERSRLQTLPRTRETLHRSSEELWERLAEEVDSIPTHELERLRLAGVRRGHAVDSSHPPTHLRRACLSLAVPRPPEVAVDAAREARIATELSDARRSIAKGYLEGS
jgi:Zn-dependent protease with chaperone function